MRQRSIQAHPWLFAFVDLAFLMLIVMTQIGDHVEMQRAELGDITLPRLQRAAVSELPGHAREIWQLRVHPPRGSSAGPFELVAAGGKSREGTGGWMSLVELQARLDSLSRAGEERPLLAPHRKSESQHLLDAVAALEERWPSRRRSVIARLARN